MKYINFTVIIIVIITLFYNNKIVHSDSDYEIKVDYPQTNYSTLNDVIKNKMDSYVHDFKNNITNNQTSKYYLIINYDTYSYKDYVSYLFMSEYYTGGAHPNHDMWAIVFNTKNNEIITLDNLINYNKNVLNVFSNYSRERLLYNKKIVDTSMMLEGTRPTKDNFSTFVLTNNGIILFFNRYQVAPYSSGDFKVLIPYENIKNSN